MCCGGGLRSYPLKRISNVRIQATRRRREREKKKSSSSEKDGPRIKNGFKRKLANDGSTTHGDVLVNRVTLLCTRREKKRKTNPGSDERPTQVA